MIIAPKKEQKNLSGLSFSIIKCRKIHYINWFLCQLHSFGVSTYLRKVFKYFNQKNKNMVFDQPTSVYIVKITNWLCGMLWSFGLWKPFEKSNWQQFLYSSYSIIFLTIFSVIYAALMVCDIFFLTDFTDLTNRLYMSLTEAALVIKVINFFLNNRDWQKCLSDLKDFRIKSLAEERIMQKSARIFYIMMSVYFLCPNCSVHALGITPLFSTETTLMYTGWYPGFNWQSNSRDYWCVYAYQYIGILITCNLNVAIDSYYCFLMHTISAQIKIFGHRLSLIHFIENENTTQVNRLNLIEKIHTHQRLNATFNLIQHNLQWAYFCQVLLSGIVICSITKELSRVRQLMKFVFFFSGFDISMLFFRHPLRQKRPYLFQLF